MIILVAEWFNLPKWSKWSKWSKWFSPPPDREPGPVQPHCRAAPRARRMLAESASTAACRGATACAKATARRCDPRPGVARFPSNRYISVKTRRTPGASDLIRDGTFTEYAILHGTQNVAATHFPYAKNHFMPTFTKKIFGCAEALVRIGMGSIIGAGPETAEVCSSGSPWHPRAGHRWPGTMAVPQLGQCHYGPQWHSPKITD